MYRILLAEDNRLNQVVAAGLLNKLGYATEIVDSGLQAVMACGSTRFDAVLMDIMMPTMDGYQATAKIRENEAATGSPHVPIIGLSARAMAGDRDIALAAGLDDYLTKPLREADLQSVLEHWVVGRASV